MAKEDVKTLNNLLVDTGIKKVELARRMGVDPTTISRMFNPDHDQSLEALRRVAKATGKLVVWSFIDDPNVIQQPIEQDSNLD